MADPAPDIDTQVDFYYERDGIPGICVFDDGPHHDQPAQAERDKKTRDDLEAAGFRTVVISHDRDLAEQVDEYGDVFVGL